MCFVYKKRLVSSSRSCKSIKPSTLLNSSDRLPESNHGKRKPVKISQVTSVERKNALSIKYANKTVSQNENETSLSF